MAAGALDENMCILAHQEAPIDIYACPLQHLKAEVLDVAARARHRYAASQRTALHGVTEIDHHIIKKLCGKMKGEDAKIVEDTMNLATWDDNQKAKLENLEGGVCSLCGDQNGTLAHLIGRCRKPDHVREDKEIVAF